MIVVLNINSVLVKRIIIMGGGGSIMKKLSSLLATLTILLAPLAIGGVAAAESTCQIGFTGPNSQNLCESTTAFTCTVTNDNKIIFKNNNEQVAETGDAITGSSGSATNENGVTFTGTVTNNGNTCIAIATVPPTVTPTVTPKPVTPAPAVTPAGGQGAIQPTVLPNTASGSPLMYVATLIGLVGAIAVVSRLAVMLYAHLKS